MIKCPECGCDNTSDSNYCRRCGEHLLISRGQEATSRGITVGAPPSPPALPADFLPVDRTVLQIRSPDDREGEILPVESDVTTIGRSPKSDLFLDDVTVSRHHARILLGPYGPTIEDRGSLNGTYVNRRRIESHELFDGDEVQIGKFKLAFLVPRSEE